MRRSNEYWERRAQQRMADYHRQNDEVVRRVVTAYDRGQQNVLESIERIFGTYLKNSGMTPEEAQRLLSEPISRREWERIRDQYRKARDPDIRRRLLAILNSRAYAARITRRMAMQADMLVQSKLIADAEIRLSTQGYIDTINEAYYRTLFDIQQGVGYAFDFATIPRRTVEAIVRRPWSGEHFSSRIWDNTDVLARTLTQVITGGIMSGASIEKMRKQLEERFNVAKHAANRLIRTETTYFANMAEMEAYEEAEIERYRFVATLDLRTSQMCRQHDNKVYLVKDARPGVNMPPLHPYCRSTTIAVIDVGDEYNMQRRARDPKTGKPMLVPANMSYQEWYEKYVTRTA